MKKVEKRLMEAVRELKEMSVEASPQGWTVIIGNRKTTPAELSGALRKAFDEVRGYLKRDGLIKEISQKYREGDPKNIVFKSPGTATINDEDGKPIKSYALSTKIQV